MATELTPKHIQGVLGEFQVAIDSGASSAVDDVKPILGEYTPAIDAVTAVTAAGTYTHTPTGGITASEDPDNSPIESFVYTLTTSGGVICFQTELEGGVLGGGSATFGFLYPTTITGGIKGSGEAVINLFVPENELFEEGEFDSRVGGAADISPIYTPAIAGGIQGSGAATEAHVPQLDTYNITVAGGIIASGESQPSLIHSLTGSGGLEANGEATHSYSVTVGGGLVANGEAAYGLTYNIEGGTGEKIVHEGLIEPSGALVNGEATVSGGQIEFLEGGLILSGDPSTEFIYNHSVSGSALTNGVAFKGEIEPPFISSGGFLASGLLSTNATYTHTMEGGVTNDSSFGNMASVFAHWNFNVESDVQARPEYAETNEKFAFIELISGGISANGTSTVSGGTIDNNEIGSGGLVANGSASSDATGSGGLVSNGLTSDTLSAVGTDNLLVPTGTTVESVLGHIGKGSRFVEGDGDYLEIVNDTSQFFGFPPDFTISVWVKLDSIEGNIQGIVTKSHGALISEHSFRLYHDPDLEQFRFGIGHSSSGEFATVTSGVNLGGGTQGPVTLEESGVKKGVWYHIIAWYKSNSTVSATQATSSPGGRLYISVNGQPNAADGEPLFFDTLTTPLDLGPSNATIKVGRLHADGTKFKGVIDELTIWANESSVFDPSNTSPGQLTATERSLLYNGGQGRVYPFKDDTVISNLQTETPTGGLIADSSAEVTVTYTYNVAGDVAVMPIRYEITVATKLDGSHMVFFLNGIESPSISFETGRTYYFDATDPSTDGHPFYLSTNSTGGGGGYVLGSPPPGQEGPSGVIPSGDYLGEYLDGVTGSRSCGSCVVDGHIQQALTILVPDDAPSTLYYYCGNHKMGGTITVTKSEVFTAGGSATIASIGANLIDNIETSGGISLNGTVEPDTLSFGGMQLGGEASQYVTFDIHQPRVKYYDVGISGSLINGSATDFITHAASISGGLQASSKADVVHKVFGVGTTYDEEIIGGTLLNGAALTYFPFIGSKVYAETPTSGLSLGGEAIEQHQFALNYTSLVAHWNFEESSGTRADSSPNSNDLLESGNSSVVGSTTGAFDKAGDFVANETDYLKANHSGSLNFGYSTKFLFTDSGSGGSTTGGNATIEGFSQGVGSIIASGTATVSGGSPVYHETGSGGFTASGTGDFYNETMSGGITASGYLDSLKSTDFTISTWVKLNSLALKRQGIISKGHGTELKNNIFQIFYEPVSVISSPSGPPTVTSQFAFSVGDGFNYSQVTSLVPNGVQANAWYHIVATYDSSEELIYITVDDSSIVFLNGIDSIAPRDGYGELKVGRTGQGSTYLDGQIDETTIWKTVTSFPWHVYGNVTKTYPFIGNYIINEEPTGGIELGDSSYAPIMHTNYSDGGLISGGIPESTITQIPLYLEGGFLASGTSTASGSETATPAGGITLSGDAVVVELNEFVPSGGLVASGDADRTLIVIPEPDRGKFAYDEYGSGGAVLSGVAIVEPHLITVFDGFRASGEAEIDFIFSITVPAGGVSASGEEQGSCLYHIIPHQRRLYEEVGGGGLKAIPTYPIGAAAEAVPSLPAPFAWELDSSGNVLWYSYGGDGIKHYESFNAIVHSTVTYNEIGSGGLKVIPTYPIGAAAEAVPSLPAPFAWELDSSGNVLWYSYGGDGIEHSESFNAIVTGGQVAYIQGGLQASGNADSLAISPGSSTAKLIITLDASGGIEAADFAIVEQVRDSITDPNVFTGGLQSSGTADLTGTSAKEIHVPDISGGVSLNGVSDEGIWQDSGKAYTPTGGLQATGLSNLHENHEKFVHVITILGGIAVNGDVTETQNLSVTETVSGGLTAGGIPESYITVTPVVTVVVSGTSDVLLTANLESPTGDAILSGEAVVARILLADQLNGVFAGGSAEVRSGPDMVPSGGITGAGTANQHSTLEKFSHEIIPTGGLFAKGTLKEFDYTDVAGALLSGSATASGGTVIITETPTGGVVVTETRFPEEVGSGGAIAVSATTYHFLDSTYKTTTAKYAHESKPLGGITGSGEASVSGGQLDVTGGVSLLGQASYGITQTYYINEGYTFSRVGGEADKLYIIDIIPTGGLTADSVAPMHVGKVVIGSGVITLGGLGIITLDGQKGGLQSAGEATIQEIATISVEGGAQLEGISDVTSTGPAYHTVSMRVEGSATVLLVFNPEISGGVQTAGEADFVFSGPELVQTHSRAGGSADVVATYPLTVSGGILANGVTTELKEFTFTVAGGVIGEGVATEEFYNTFVPSGGAIGEGAATENEINIFNPSGGIEAGSSATIVLTIDIIPTGGIVAEGISTRAEIEEHDTAGGIVASGAAEESMSFIGQGGISSNGTAESVVTYTLLVSGGISASGEAIAQKTYTPQGSSKFVYDEYGSGGIQLSGQATIEGIALGDAGVLVGGDADEVRREKFAYVEYPEGGITASGTSRGLGISITTSAVIANGSADVTTSRTIHVEVAEGGLIANGAMINNPAVQGGATLNGTTEHYVSFVIVNRFYEVPTGGSIVSGRIFNNPTISGGASLNGSSINLHNSEYGASLGGSATLEYTVNYQIEDGKVLIGGGTADEDFLDIFEPSGGILAGGDNVQAGFFLEYIPSGGVLDGGFGLSSYLEQPQLRPSKNVGLALKSSNIIKDKFEIAPTKIMSNKITFPVTPIIPESKYRKKQIAGWCDVEQRCTDGVLPDVIQKRQNEHLPPKIKRAVSVSKLGIVGKLTKSGGTTTVTTAY